MNQFRSDSRKLRATEDTVTASVRDRAMTAVVTPVRPGERLSPSTATRPSNPKSRGKTGLKSIDIQLISGIARMMAETHRRRAAVFPQTMDRVVCST